MLTVFDSIFLFVTGAFNFSGAGFAAARDEGFAVDTVVLATVLGAALETAFVGALPGVFALPTGSAAAFFFTADLAIDLLEAGLVAAGFAFFASGVGFAGFFIAFAMESIPNWIALIAQLATHAEPIKLSTLHWLGIRLRDIPENSRLS